MLDVVVDVSCIYGQWEDEASVEVTPEDGAFDQNSASGKPRHPSTLDPKPETRNPKPYKTM